MTHHDKGNFAAKHPKGATVSNELQQAVAERRRGQVITCAAAHAIARELNIAPAEVGKAIDLSECRISKCQLGLFGYHPEKKIVVPAAEVPPDPAQSITAHLHNNRLSCEKAWQLAETQNISKLEFCAVCEALNIKISPCQLGAF